MQRDFRALTRELQRQERRATRWARFVKRVRVLFGRRV
jgi:hypothetical protein